MGNITSLGPAANLLSSLTMKEMCNLVNICQSCAKD